jgi:hypothetical protein
MKKLLIAFVFIGGMLGKSLAQQKTTTTPQNTKTEQKTGTQTQKTTKTQPDPKKQQPETKKEEKKEIKKEVKKEINPRIENCNPAGYITDITESLKASGFKFLRSYKLEGVSNKPIQHEYTFSKGTTYTIRVASYLDSRLKVILYDPEGRAIASTYNADSDKFYPSIQIQCNKTGVYKISFEHHLNKRDFCGGAILGFKR